MKKISLCLLSLSLFMISCTDEIDGLTFEKVSPVVSAPIGTITINTDKINDFYDSTTFNNINLSLSDDGSVSLQNLNLRLITENSSSKSFAVQLYFMDSTEASGDIVLDSLFDGYEASVIAPAAEVNSDGTVISATTLLSDISIDQEKYERIKPSSKIKLVAKILNNGENEAPPKRGKATANNYLSISSGLSAQAIIDPAKF